MANIFKGKRVLITGGTGTLGEQLIKTIRGAKEVRVLSRSEKGQIPLKRKYGHVNFILGDMRDYNSVRSSVIGTDIVIHAAAFKFIDLAEKQPRECVLTNINGSMNLIDAINEVGGVDVCVGISTDKAVYARNVYGCTKHIMEKLFSEADRYSDTRFTCVRYGNVIGSTGSVFEIWRNQISDGKEITVTDKKMNRFFFTIKESVGLIIYAIEHTTGGDIFINKMKAYNMYDLAKKITNKIKIIGLRPGEKLDEVLIADYEGQEYSTKHGLKTIKTKIIRIGGK